MESKIKVKIVGTDANGNVVDLTKPSTDINLVYYIVSGLQVRHANEYTDIHVVDV